ncbi:MAG TPA: ATP-binding protein [Candidatus Acidoferrum sp.]|nr:ATP-binding protein [Candidatus Acidoferrum sp.]
MRPKPIKRKFLMQTQSIRNMVIGMRASRLIWSWRVAVCCGLTVVGAAATAQLAEVDRVFNIQNSAEVTNVHQICLLAARVPGASYSFHLEGDVWWANPTLGKLVLKDNSGAEELEMDFRGGSVESGQRVLLEGNGTITPTGAGFRIGAKGPVVDNDGVHDMVEKSGAVYLKAGRNPIRVEWFNGVEKYGLKVEYQGPGLSRQAIPDSALFRNEEDGAGGASNQVNGLDFLCSEAPTEVLPDFNPATALKTGTVNNFDLRVVARPEHVGICFTGFLDVPRNGLYAFYTTSDDGSRLFAGEPSLQLKVIGRTTFPKAQPLVIGQTLRRREDRQWVEVEGKVTFASEKSDGLQLELSTETGRMRLEVANKSGLLPALLLNHRVRATGFCQSAYTADGQEVLGVLLVPTGQEITPLEPPAAAAASTVTNAGALPLLVNAAEVHRLKREEAQRGYPVKIRGVITSVLPEHQAFTIQDSTRGIYVTDYSESRIVPPRIGEYLEVEGRTDPSLFAPIVNANRVTDLGAGRLPQPVHPAWDQLMNGSLDAQYVELQGIITTVDTNGVTLFTGDGRIRLELRVAGMNTEALERYEDAVVRVRGCLFASWDYVTHQVKVGEIRVNGAEISVDQPAPTDIFSLPLKSIAELLQFNPQAGVFQQVKVSGQIIHAQAPEYYLMDGNNGLQFVLKKPVPELEVGDQVEVVGFPGLSGASPLLHEAVARKIGHAALPEARKLQPNNLIREEYDSTRVKVDGLLVSVRDTPVGQALEMRSGVRAFMARLNTRIDSVRSLAPGSLLELVGVYIGEGGNRATGQDITSFQLLLNSPSDIAVLARPPWWTLEKLLVILGALACVLTVTALWVTQLRRKVEQRTAELEIQIQERQRVEQQHTMEQERARIAQDLHDELGSGLTEISMLGARARSASVLPETRGSYLEQMSDKARQMVTALDEIVWAMNPTHDSLASMTSYFSLYAERFLGLANIAWRLESPLEPDDYAVDSRHRHQLFLAFKEALTNIVRHSGATEVRLNIQVKQGQVCLSIADNGRGSVHVGPTEGMDGVANMRARLEKLGGRFEVNSRTGQGTIVRFELPLR